jgi:hypothetical protein
MSEPCANPPQVLSAINAVMLDIAKVGVGKNKTNQQQNFAYRAVDDVMDALAPVLGRHGLIITPHVLERDAQLRETRNGGTMMHVTLKIEYDFESKADGSLKKVGPIYGEAMDAGDKATNKAMAVAYKYATTQEFCIPLSGDDPDAQSHELAGTSPDRAQRSEPRHESPSNAASATRSEASPQSVPKPTAWRPTGNFGYGKKFFEVPWSVMTTRDLEWFLDAERTPSATKDKIIAELQWREYEASQLDAADAAHRADLKKPFDDQVP